VKKMKKMIKALAASSAAAFAFVYSTSIVGAADISTWGAKCSPSGVPTDIRKAIMNVTNWILGGIIGIVICGLAYAMVIVVSTVILSA
jgi:hypothetical protein